MILPWERPDRHDAGRAAEARLAELCDYLQADELTHVRLATRWIRRMTDDRPAYRDELVAWSKQAVDRLQSFGNDAYNSTDFPEPRFSFLRGSEAEEDEFAGPVSSVIGE